MSSKSKCGSFRSLATARFSEEPSLTVSTGWHLYAGHGPVLAKGDPVIAQSMAYPRLPGCRPPDNVSLHPILCSPQCSCRAATDTLAPIMAAGRAELAMVPVT